MQRKKLKDLNLLDDFLFNAMMTHPEVGEKFTHRILECVFEKEFSKLKVIPQRTYGGMDTDLRGARLDVYVEGEESLDLDAETEVQKGAFIYDLEADLKNNRTKKKIEEFPKRARFYHALIDSHALKTSEEFGNLKRVYVIFISDYDPFGYDRVKYTIKNACMEEPGMPYEDGARTMVLYTKGSKGEVSEKLSQLLRYMEHTTWENAVNDTLKEIQEMVEIVKRDQEVTVGYMKWFERDRMLREESLEEGRAEERKNTEVERQRADEAEKKLARVDIQRQQEKEELEAQRQRAERAEEGREEERKNTEAAERKMEAQRQRADEAERMLAELKAELRKYQK